ncbi:uncharacterized protein LACBIDRAFT_313684 [Laccaria bicolor S238N-H82]|uniref:Predicted protein n=1 Tax=Laccaria bicolor (strain S238N-H82 / ATCC MYA-4686) TaxID=486041 RepID=B0D0K6_LACBS|nr:uncharacterized protein LACBIDRAFT_313684 [Laccaria bicolor S238N-H82]EDR11478.1 predicted protein [Laccaria bicolor S238N-H82]|eukprot:XP_001877375.1 predicted protein [Laccaria bicolor S238N-H82]
MSEGHANLFASAIPENGSSSTMGSNPIGTNDEDQANPTGQDGPGTRDRANSVAQDENLNDDTGEIQIPLRNNESNDDLDEFT